MPRFAFPASSLSRRSVLLASLLCLVVGACAGGEAPPPESREVAEEGEVSEATPMESPAFDYPGGWLDDGACVDICGVTPESPVERPPAVVCFDPENAECAAKTGDGDYDYLMLSQHWLPSMCLGLEAGYDSTVTHKAGARCVPGAPSRLTLHGLWPNYEGGFPQCCGSASPLDPTAMKAWPPGLSRRLWVEQPDPTVGDFEAAICEIYNHEWQKHGTCFSAVAGGSVDAAARAYFERGLELVDRLAEANRKVDAWAGESRTRGEIEALYEHAVQVLCDANSPTRLLEIRSCWSRAGEQVDCAPTEGFGVLKSCGERVELPVWED